MRTSTDTLRTADWERIEAEYRAGLLSLREIAALDGRVTESAIRKRARRDSWDRDLKAKIRARAEALVRKDQVRTALRTEGAASELQIIESNAQYVAGVLTLHKRGSDRLANLGLNLLAEVEMQTAELPAFERLAELVAKAGEAGGVDKVMAGVFDRVISLHGRLDAARKASEIIKIGFAVQREANNIGAGAPAGTGRPLVVIRDFTGKGDLDSPLAEGLQGMSKSPQLMVP